MGKKTSMNRIELRRHDNFLNCNRSQYYENRNNVKYEIVLLQGNTNSSMLFKSSMYYKAMNYNFF